MVDGDTKTLVSVDMAYKHRLAMPANCQREKPSGGAPDWEHVTTTFNIEISAKGCSQNKFFWIMGADNLVQFRKWHRHRDIVGRIPIAVIDRPGYSYAVKRRTVYFPGRVPARRLEKLERVKTGQNHQSGASYRNAGTMRRQPRFGRWA